MSRGIQHIENPSILSCQSRVMDFCSLHMGLCTIIQVDLIVGDPKSGLKVSHETCINNICWEVI